MTLDEFPFVTSSHNVTVGVASYFLGDQSNPDQAHYVWAYRICIKNDGDEAVQLISRHWIITDGKGRTEHVRGPGVIGEQPVLQPGESFEYSSGCPLSTPSGFMVGTYQMVREDGETFEAEIPAFPLDSPHSGVTLH
jgi:ApaG protein